MYLSHNKYAHDQYSWHKEMNIKPSVEGCCDKLLSCEAEFKTCVGVDASTTYPSTGMSHSFNVPSLLQVKI
jgi:hypothetical protein